MTTPIDPDFYPLRLATRQHDSDKLGSKNEVVQVTKQLLQARGCLVVAFESASRKKRLEKLKGIT